MNLSEGSGFAEWKSLSFDPERVAGEFLRRVQSQLSPEQRRAALAWLPDRGQLVADLAAAGKDAPLGGLPCLIKDLFDVKGAPTSAGSTFLSEVRQGGASDSRMVADLRAKGLVIAGKSQMHEFACGNTGENPHYGDCERPGFPGRLAGGSSSGSAACVAAGIVPFSTGTDTGGSIRGPAAFCGIHGMRLAPGNDWIRDAFPVSPTFDSAGWFTASAADMLLANEGLLGPAPAARDPRGVYLEYGTLEPEVALACREAAAAFCPSADKVTRDSLSPVFSDSEQTYTVLTGVEVARVHAAWLDRFRERYSPAVWSRIDAGRHCTAAEVRKAHVHQGAIRSAFESYFGTYDFLLLPAVPCPALTKEQCTPENRRRMLQLAAPATLARLPVLTLPVALPSGLSVGLQLVVPTATSPAVAWALRRGQ